ncbi:SMI1/KNR4 family protein [Pseudomonas sp. NFXW11]|uniref:SMI1/KNR4 family protein n=1 Tax=Pseudomonas sp. NFXW11 TaxID=2819531 RepID=UPI003CE87E8A
MRDIAELSIYYQNFVVEREIPSLEQLAEFQARHGIKLPDDYVAFIRSINGGIPTLNFFTNEECEFVVETFHHLSLIDDQDDCYNISIASAWPSEDLGRTLIAIAGDGSGDQLVFDLSLGPQVRLWRHDDGQQPVIIAASFADFIDRLEPEPEDDQ